MFIQDYINKLEVDLQGLFPDKVPLVVDDAANFIDGKYIPKSNEFVVVVNSGNATIEKIQNIKSFAAPVHLYIYVPFEEREKYQEKLFEYLVEQSDSDTLFEVGEYTAGFAYNTPSCDGKAKKINGKDYAIYLVMGNANYVEGIGKFENDIYIDETKLEGIINMAFSLVPVIENVGVIGKRFSDAVEVYQTQEINITVLLNSKNALHKELILLASGGGSGNVFKTIKIVNDTNAEELIFRAYLKLNMSDQNKLIKAMNIIIAR